MLIALTLDGSSARVADRERWVPPPGSTPPVPTAPFAGLFRFTTCYRIELYGWFLGNPTDPAGAARALAARWYGTAGPEFQAGATVRTGAAAARHLLRVAGGLESPSAGDQHLLAQVRRAYADAGEAGALGSALDRLLQTALRTGRRIRRESAFGAGAGSVASLAAEAVFARHGRALGRCVVVGAGPMAAAVAQAISAGRPGDLVIVNRGSQGAERVARRLGARTAPLDRLAEEIAAADVIVTATGSPTPLVTAEMVSRRDDCGETLILDLALPRNADPRIRGTPGVRLLDLDDLTRSPAALPGHRAERDGAERIVAEECTRFDRWLAEGTGRAAIEPLREALEEACRREVAFIATPDLADRVARRVVARVCAGPMKSFRSQIALGGGR